MNNLTTFTPPNDKNKELRIKNKGSLFHFSQLQVWQASKQLIKLVYKCTQLFPKVEQYGLSQQLRRASVSISSNIAEGFGRRTQKDKAHFYTMARGSLDEVECQLIIANELGMLTFKDLSESKDILLQINKMLNSLIKKTTETQKFTPLNS